MMHAGARGRGRGGEGVDDKDKDILHGSGGCCPGGAGRWGDAGVLRGERWEVDTVVGGVLRMKRFLWCRRGLRSGYGG